MEAGAPGVMSTTGNGSWKLRGRKGPKLTGLILRIAYGPCKQKDRVGLDWLVKRLGCRYGPSRCTDRLNRVGPRILETDSAFGVSLVESQSRGGRVGRVLGS